MTAKRVIVTGRVQGVWFRAWTEEQAKALGLYGWVRNRSDGTVEAVLAGENSSVQAMIDRLKQGPRLASVDEVLVEDTAEPPHQDFQVKPTF